MVHPKLLHYRDHHNGGKFDENCHVDCGYVKGDASYPVRIRFRITDFDSGYQYLWGAGSGASQYSLKLVRDTNDYYLRVTYLDVDYNFTDYRLDIDLTEIHCAIIWVDKYDVNIRYFTSRYGKRIPFLTLANISDEVTYSLPTTNLYIGASSTVVAHKFGGTVFDFETHYVTGGTGIQRLVFYEKYNGTSSNIVYSDDSPTYDASIANIPTDFWSSETDISDYIAENDPPKVSYRQDKYRTPEFSATKFKLFNYFNVSVDDTIGIKINDKLTWLFNVVNIKITDHGHYLEVETEGIMKHLEETNSIVYTELHLPTFNVFDRKWWSNFVPTATEFYETGTNLEDSWMSLTYIFKQAIYFMQYDNILTVDVSALSGVDSPYEQHVSSAYVDYDKLVFSWYMFRALNKSNMGDYDDSASMSDIFREILMITRTTFYIDDGVLLFVPLETGNVFFNEDDIWERELLGKVIKRKYHHIICDIVSDWTKNYNFESTIKGHSMGTYNDGDRDLLKLVSSSSPSQGIPAPVMISYSNFKSDDILTLDANDIDNVITDYNNKSIEKLTLVPHMWLLYRDGSSVMRTFRNSSDSQNFIHQLAAILDEELRGTFNYEIITVELTENNSPKYLEKKDDPAKRKTIIKQEVAS